MPTFSKFIDGQRGSQQMVDSDGFIYSRKKPRDTPLYSAWRCRKNNPHTKCPCHAYLTLTDDFLTLGSKPHNHPADNAAPLKREVLSILKGKAAEQPLSVTQNILSEVLADSTPETNQTLPTMESLARVVQCSRAVSSDDFLLPPTCTSTRRDEPFVLYDGSLLYSSEPRYAGRVQQLDSRWNVLRCSQDLRTELHNPRCD
ncbi:hypothetical protein ACHWQZ_G014888 [Mnemiopsis leidyi]